MGHKCDSGLVKHPRVTLVSIELPANNFRKTFHEARNCSGCPKMLHRDLPSRRIITNTPL